MEGVRGPGLEPPPTDNAPTLAPQADAKRNVEGKQGDKAKADELYRTALTSNAHDPATAYARPVATKKLGLQ